MDQPTPLSPRHDPYCNGLLFARDCDCGLESLRAERDALLKRLESRKPAACKCDFRTYMVGDGCEVCNPAKALEYAKGTIDDLQAECDALRAKLEKTNGALDFYKERERYFAEALNIADGGQYRSDWDARLRRAIESASLNTALTARVQALEGMLKKILPEQNPLHAEISCDYCTAFQNMDLDEEDSHDPDCPWLLVYGPALNSTPAADLQAHDEAVRREVVERIHKAMPRYSRLELIWFYRAAGIEP